MFEETSNFKELANILNNRALVYSESGDYVTAIEYHKKSNQNLLNITYLYDTNSITVGKLVELLVPFKYLWFFYYTNSLLTKDKMEIAIVEEYSRKTLVNFLANNIKN